MKWASFVGTVEVGACVGLVEVGVFVGLVELSVFVGAVEVGWIFVPGKVGTLGTGPLQQI